MRIVVCNLVTLSAPLERGAIVSIIATCLSKWDLARLRVQISGAIHIAVVASGLSNEIPSGRANIYICSAQPEDLLGSFVSITPSGGYWYARNNETIRLLRSP